MKLLYIIAGVLFFQSCEAQKIASLPKNKDSNTLLWEIRGKGLKNPSYLFGTFHLLCKDDTRFSNNLQQALEMSDEVYFEMDLDDPAMMLGGLLFMNMKNGKTLKDLYTPEDFEKISQFFKDSLHINLGMFGKMKPMMLESFLYPRLMPCKNASGVEMELMTLAKKQKKEIKGFETMEFQASVFDSIPYGVQAKALLKDIDSSAKFKSYLQKMVDIYTTQQTDKLAALVSDTAFSGGENNDILLKNRNENWVKQLKTILKEKNIFMAVGAGHLFGKDGLLELLRKEGYNVSPLLNK